MNSSKFLIFSLLVTLMCNDGALARRRLKDLKFGIIDHDPINAEGFDGMTLQKITEDLEKLDVSLSKSDDLLAEENNLKTDITDHDPTDQEGFVGITEDLKKLDVSLSKSADLLAEENDLKSGIMDQDPKHPKDIGQEGFEVEKKVGTPAQKIMKDMKKLICMMAYGFPRSCGNFQLEITSSDESRYEENRQTTVKPRPKRSEKNIDSIDFKIRIMKR